MSRVRDYLFYEEPGIQLFCGDARQLIQAMPAADSIVTDPVWPTTVFPGVDDPAALLAKVLGDARALRLVIQLGCDSDPRFLCAVPTEWPFLRSCFLEYVRPHYKGRLLYTNDVAYVFGKWPASRQGARVFPGKTIQTDHQKRAAGHPCARQPQHVEWLVGWFARGLVLDPFCGTGTTLAAAKNAGLPAIGIEIEPRYCEIAVKRLRQEVLPL
mgnify:CR=1 FL=1